MLIQVLAEYADHYLADQLNDAAWESKPVPWLIEISPDGRFLGSIPRTKEEPMGKKTVTVALQMSVPRSPVNRNSGEHPLLAADDIAYVLGAGNWSGSKQSDRDKADAHHAAFVALLQKADASTHLVELAACTRFYANPEEVQEARKALQTAKPGSIVALSVGRPLVELEEVRAYWRNHYETEFNARMEGDEAECLISGDFGPVAPTHEKIKGAVSLGGQAAGVSLMSFDKEAFRSYGWERNTNSPVSPNRALAYVLAINDLLRPGGSASNVEGQSGKVRRCDKAGVGFLFWTRKPSSIDPFASLDPKDEGDVKALLNLNPVELDANDFYLAGVSGNGGRLRVRYWVADSLVHIQQNILGWHEQLRVDWPWDSPKPVRMKELEFTVSRDGEPTAQEELALYQRAIEGCKRPLGYSILTKAIYRIRHPKNDKHEKSSPWKLSRLRIPIGLIRLCLNDLRKKGELKMSKGLDESNHSIGYLLGRLMHLYENLQRAAFNCDRGEAERKRNPEVNASVLDRFYALASTSPTIAFPRMIELGKHHRKKLVRHGQAHIANGIERDIREVFDKFDAQDDCFPDSLSLTEQGKFALGYYQQKAYSIRRANQNQSTGLINDEIENEEN